MSTPPTENAPERTTPARRGKWRRRLLWFAVFLCLLGWAINEPIARRAVHYGIDSQLSKRGFFGDVTVSGSLLGGFQLSHFSYQGNQGIQSLSAHQAELHYNSLSELSNGKVTGFTIKGLDLVIDLEKFPPSDKPSPPLSETLGSIQVSLQPLEIQLSDTKVRLLKSGTPFLSFRADKLSTAASSPLYQLRGFQAQDGKNNATPLQSVSLRWEENHFSTEQLELLPDITLSDTQLTVKSTLSGSSKVELLGAHFQLDLAERLEISLLKGELDTRSFSERFDLNLPFSATCNKLQLATSDWRKPFNEWQLEANAHFPAFHYQDEQLTNANLVLEQKEQGYLVDLKSEQGALDLNGTWTQPTAERWWEHTAVDYSLTLPNIPVTLQSRTKEVVDLDLSQTTLESSGNFNLQNLTLESLSADSKITGLLLKENQLPALSLHTSYQHQKNASIQIEAQRQQHTPLSLSIDYQVNDDTFAAELNLQENDPAWLNRILTSYGVEAQLLDTVDISWKGTGTSDLSVNQSGTLSVDALTVKTPHTTALNLTTKANYQWPEFVAFDDFQLSDARFHTSFDLDWRDDTLTLRDGSLKELGKDTASFRAQLPLSLEIDSAQHFFAQQEPWAISLHSAPLSLPRLVQWFRLSHIPQLADLEGNSALTLEIAGSPAKPHLNGTTKLQDLRGIANQDLAALHILGTFATAADTFYFSGELLEAKDQRATLNLQLPFTPQQWLQSTADEIVQNTTLDGSISINKLPLNRLARFVQQLKSLDGHLTGKATLSGTLADPKAQLDTHITIPKVVIAGRELDDIRDISIHCTANSEREVNAELSASINGGEFTGKAAIDFEQLTEPRFDITLATNHAMLFRNNSLSIRANADLRLLGTLDEATLSGDIALVESLFYKDIDILPIGVPSSAVADVELPTLNPNQFYPEIPEPFRNWKLDLSLRTKDPLLVRGNLARGSIEADVKALGTLGTPQLDGNIIAKDVVARLPFSQLKVRKGYAYFSPKDGLIPRLDIQGNASVGNYDTSLYVYGPLTSPQTSFTSSPPLPQNEIMTLLATGVTASGLQNNKEVATLRALQLFLVKLRQESGGNKGNQLLEKILAKIQDFELNINATDHFTGRKFSSAKVNLNRRFYFTAQIDGKKQTRGLLVFVIKSQ